MDPSSNPADISLMITFTTTESMFEDFIKLLQGMLTTFYITSLQFPTDLIPHHSEGTRYIHQTFQSSLKYRLCQQRLHRPGDLTGWFGRKEPTNQGHDTPFRSAIRVHTLGRTPLLSGLQMKGRLKGSFHCTHLRQGITPHLLTRYTLVHGVILVQSSFTLSCPYFDTSIIRCSLVVTMYP